MKTIKSLQQSPFCKRTMLRILATVFFISAILTGTSSPAYAAKTLQESDFYIGLMALLNDTMQVAMIACPIVGGLFCVYYLIRRGMADEQDGKMWNKRIWTAIICGVGGSLVTGIIALITSYVSSPTSP